MEPMGVPNPPMLQAAAMPRIIAVAKPGVGIFAERMTETPMGIISNAVAVLLTKNEMAMVTNMRPAMSRRGRWPSWRTMMLESLRCTP